MKKYILYTLLLTTFTLSLISCDTVENNSNGDPVEGSNPKSDDWLIPQSEVFDGGPGKDGIPALTNPNLTSMDETSYLGEKDLVLIYSHDGQTRIYPHPILDWHEIINDRIGDHVYSITYCPLTGSGINWNRFIDGEVTTFGVSGLLYNTNLLPYDRKTQSNWSQMKLQSVNGELITTHAEVLPLLETSWETAKIMYPNARVVSIGTGYSRNYGSYPYGDYRTNHSKLIFPVDRNDVRLQRKERVLGVISNGSSKAYSINDFENNMVIEDLVGNDKIIIYGDKDKNLIAAFKITGLNSGLVFSKSSQPLPWIIADNTGNNYDVFGRSQNSTSNHLEPAKSFVAYWFAWATFYHNTDLYLNN